MAKRQTYVTIFTVYFSTPNQIFPFANWIIQVWRFFMEFTFRIWGCGISKNTPFGTLFLRSGVFNLCIYLLRVTFLWEHKIHFSALRQLSLFNATSSLQNTSLVPQMKVILKSTELELLQLLSSCCRRKQTATSAECWGQTLELTGGRWSLTSSVLSVRRVTVWRQTDRDGWKYHGLPKVNY